MACRDKYGHLHPLSKTQCLSIETIAVCLCHLETIKSDGMQRQIWSSTPFVEDSMSIDQDYFSLPSSSKDNQVRWHAETNMVICSLWRKLNVFQPWLLKSPLSTGGKQVCWQIEINMVICSLCRRLNVFRLRLLKSHLRYPKTSESDSTQRQIMVIRTFAIQRQSSPMTHRDKLWSSSPFQRP